MLTRSRIQVDGVLNPAVVIPNGATVIVHPGSSATAHTFFDCRNMPFMRFGAFFDQPVTIDIMGSWDSIAYFIYDTLNLAANTFGSVYNLAAPRNGNGLYVLQWPYFQLEVTNTGAAPTAVQQLWWWIQNYR